MKAFIKKLLNIIRGNSATANQKALLKKWAKNGVYLEIGVWKGDFSHQILRVCKPKMLHLLDPWEFQPKFKNRMFGGSVAKSQTGMDEIFDFVKNRFSKYANVKFHRGYSSDLGKSFSDESLDAVYIDGNHYYDYVLADLHNYWRKVKVGGMIAGDDYYWSASDVKGTFPVKDAVSTFLKEKEGVVTFIELIGDQFVLRRIR